MREPRPEQRVYGLLAEFDRSERLIEAARRTREAGYTRFEAFSPFPIEGLAEAVGFKDVTVPIACLLGGLAGGAAGYGMQVYTNLNYPLNIGGRPLIAPPAFALITFELVVLGAVVAAVLAMLALNGLPRLHHPLFELAHFHLASSDKFFLAIQSNDPKFDCETSREFLEQLEPLRVDAIPFAEEPE